ncbi:helix-turn-helix domain-containing protein [Phytomonospora sp. NPDC050363]|uniref:ATP-binding protein n=1 Tax=Phytomonospora sp. NPDC050363 TaxID=3155642 RepID=UPI0033D2C93B
MGRPQRPIDRNGGPVAEFAGALRRLRDRSGALPYRTLARRANCAPSTLSDAAAGRRLPSWPVVAAFVRACGVTDESPWLARWQAAANRTPTPAPVGRIPDDPASFLGRDDELDGTVRLLDTARMVTITGPGGVGKTRLAQRIAACVQIDYRSGARWVELADLDDRALISRKILAALDQPPDPVRDPEEQLLAALSGRHLLLVLDNCEHLAAGVARLTREILTNTTGVTILATSRRALGLPEEHLSTVGPLTGPQAVGLLLERARAVLPGFDPSEAELECAARICERLDGLPLAIEFAARRLRTFSLAQLYEYLAVPSAPLADDSGVRHPRQASMAATLDWSHELCSQAARRLWCDLSVYLGGAPLEAVTSAGGAEAFGAVSELVDQSVLVNAGQRLRMLETVREYGLRRLTASGELDAARERHLDWCLSYIARADTEWYGPKQLDVLRRVRAEMPNFRVAMKYGMEAGGPASVRALRIARTLWWFWLASGTVDEGRRWLEKGIEACEDPAERFDAYWACAYVYVLIGDMKRVGELCDLAVDGGGKATIAWATLVRGLIALVAGPLEESVEVSERALRLFQAIGEDQGAQHALSQLGIAEALRGKEKEAIAWLSQGRAIAGEHGERWHRTYLLWGLGILGSKSSDPASALPMLREGLRIQEDFGDQRAVGANLEALAWVAAATGRSLEAVVLLGRSYAAWPEAESRLFGFSALLGIGERYEAELRAALEPEDFEAAYDRGGLLSPEELWDLVDDL